MENTSIKGTIGFYACLIISVIWISSHHPFAGLFWVVWAILTLISNKE